MSDKKESKKTIGFIRKGRTLVFATTGGAILSHDTVSGVLDESRNERRGRDLSGPGRAMQTR